MQSVNTKTANVDRQNFGQLMRQLREPQTQRAMVAAEIANLGKEDSRRAGNNCKFAVDTPTRKRAAEMLNVSERSVNTAKPDRVPGGKRSAQFQRKYAQAVKAIESGVIKAEVKPVSTHVSCSTRTATSILAQAVKEDERFARDSRGRVTFKSSA